MFFKQKLHIKLLIVAILSFWLEQNLFIVASPHLTTGSDHRAKEVQTVIDKSVNSLLSLLQ